MEIVGSPQADGTSFPWASHPIGFPYGSSLWVPSARGYPIISQLFGSAIGSKLRFLHVFTMKLIGISCKCSLNPIQWSSFPEVAIFPNMTFSHPTSVLALGQRSGADVLVAPNDADGPSPGGLSVKRVQISSKAVDQRPFGNQTWPAGKWKFMVYSWADHL